MSWLTANVISAFLLPPFDLFLLLLLGVFLLRYRPVIGRRIVISALLLMYVFSMPITGRTLLRSLETTAPIDLTQRTIKPTADAIVILGGGIYSLAPEYQGDSLKSYSLERVRYAATLQRATHKPILITGGDPSGGQRTEAIVMKMVLTEEFGVPVRWTEEKSRNTYENAAYSHIILEREKINKIYLVTHAWHMPRAKAAFEKVGFEVISAPTVYTTSHHLTILDFLPNVMAQVNTYWALHEYLGRLVYLVQGYA